MYIIPDTLYQVQYTYRAVLLTGPPLKTTSLLKQQSPRISWTLFFSALVPPPFKQQSPRISWTQIFCASSLLLVILNQAVEDSAWAFVPKL